MFQGKLWKIASGFPKFQVVQDVVPKPHIVVLGFHQKDQPARTPGFSQSIQKLLMVINVVVNGG